MHKFSKNKTLYGLRTNTHIKILYNTDKEEIVHIEGIEDLDPDEIEIPENKAFNIPYAIFIAGIPYYPSRYQFFRGNIYYHSRRLPAFNIKAKDQAMLGYRAKIMKARITPDMLDEHDKPAKYRKRTPSAFSIMGGSAKDQALSLIDKGILFVSPDSPVEWHWCHLVAFSMLPTHRAQVKRNLVVGSSACNGHMANIEAATKLFIYETKRPVSFEITAQIIADTDLATNIRYQISEPKSRMLYRDYFDPLTDTLSDYSDFENIYGKIMEKYKESTT